MTTTFTQKVLATAGAICMCMLAFPVSAETVVRVAEEVGVSEDQLVARDLYAVGNTVAISGAVDGDVYTVSSTVTANGSISADLTAIGGSVQVHGPVGDDLRVLGGDVVVGDVVEGDLFVIGGTLRVLSSATVTGDVFFYGGEATIEGSVGGRIGGSMEHMRIDAPVSDDVEITVPGGLTLGERANISGNVTYKSTEDIIRAQGATVSGSLVKQEFSPSPTTTDDIPILLFAAHLFALFALYFLTREHIIGFVSAQKGFVSQNALFGVLITGGIPFLTLLLMVTGIGILAGILTLSFFAALLVLSYLLAPLMLLVFIGLLRDSTLDVHALWIFVATTLFYALGLVPIFGPAMVIALTILATGALTNNLYRSVLKNA